MKKNTLTVKLVIVISSIAKKNKNKQNRNINDRKYQKAKLRKLKQVQNFDA